MSSALADSAALPEYSNDFLQVGKKMKRKLFHRRWFKSLVYAAIVFAIAALLGVIIAHSVVSFSFAKTMIVTAFLAIWFLAYIETR